VNITIKIFLTLIFILFSFESHANRYWVAKDNGNTHYWDDRANWSDRSGGKGGKTIPNNKTKVYFDNKGKGDVTFRSKGQSRRVTISGNYNGTINLNDKDLSSIKLNFSYKITNNWNLNIDNTVMKNDNKYLNNSINFNTKINL
tara:strand:+ start:2508 stop:2939 length:432 start_codon:yes stop_codon:yes gene_type:complete